MAILCWAAKNSLRSTVPLFSTIQFAIEIGHGSKMSKDHTRYSRWFDDVKSWNVKWICYNTIILITKYMAFLLCICFRYQYDCIVTNPFYIPGFDFILRPRSFLNKLRNAVKPVFRNSLVLLSCWWSGFFYWCKLTLLVQSCILIFMQPSWDGY